MLDRALLSPEAIAYFNALPLDAQIALEKSNTSFRSLDDIQDYQHCITFRFCRDARSPVQTEQAMPGSGRGAGPFCLRQQIAFPFMHICGTVVCSIGVLFYTYLWNSRPQMECHRRNHDTVLPDGNGKRRILL